MILIARPKPLVVVRATTTVSSRGSAWMDIMPSLRIPRSSLRLSDYQDAQHVFQGFRLILRKK